VPNKGNTANQKLSRCLAQKYPNSFFQNTKGHGAESPTLNPVDGINDLQKNRQSQSDPISPVIGHADFNSSEPVWSPDASA
jgi:hypothetical protein